MKLKECTPEAVRGSVTVFCGDIDYVIVGMNQVLSCPAQPSAADIGSYAHAEQSVEHPLKIESGKVTLFGNVLNFQFFGQMRFDVMHRIVNLCAFIFHRLIPFWAYDIITSKIFPDILCQVGCFLTDEAGELTEQTQIHNFTGLFAMMFSEKIHMEGI